MELRETCSRYPETAVAAWLGVPVRRLRASARLAFGRSDPVYAFRDLIVLRAVEALRRADVDSRRIGRAMREVRRLVSASSTPLTALRFHADGRSVTVEWNARRITPGGQWLLDLDLGRVEPPPIRRLPGCDRARAFATDLAEAHRALADLLIRREEPDAARVELGRAAEWSDVREP